MVSVLPAPAGHVQNPELALYYHHHVSRLSNSSKNIHHLRSQSMPEAVYIQQQQAAAAAAVSAFKPPRVRHPSGHHQPTAPNAVQMVSLRRSHTNVADFARPKGFTRSSRYWNESGCDVNSTNGGLYLARSRSNIAALGLNPEAVYRPSNQYHVVHHHGLPAQGSSSVGISRAASFYHHRDHRPMQTARSLGFLANSRSSLALPTSMNSCKDLSQPLHVDCSVEYDLGNQPKIPKDSAPLLIIHPAYQQEQLHVGPSSSSTATATSRFHPYNTSTSMISPSALEELDHKSKGSSGHGTSLASSSLSSTSSKTSNNRLPPGQRYPPQTAHHRVQPHQRPSIARHSSFLVTSPPRMVALVKGDRGHGGGQINRRSSFMEAGGRSLFHLSMPDIVIAEDAKFEHQRKQKLTMSAQQPQKPQQRFTHNKKAQHRHGHMVNSKARLNLNAKLEAVRKLSSGSASSTTHCDSGLGTPISLMDEVSSSSMTGGSSSASQNSGSSHLSKWRSSMSGLVTGFFCCSVVPPSLATQEQPPPLARNHHQKKKKMIENYNHSSPSSNVYICAPSMPIEPPLHMSSPLPGVTPSSEEAWEQDNKRYPWMASPSSNCIVSSAGSSVVSAAVKQQAMCRWCQSLNPGDDCRDGFCSSVWNKENLMRPIHI